MIRTRQQEKTERESQKSTGPEIGKLSPGQRKRNCSDLMHLRIYVNALIAGLLLENKRIAISGDHNQYAITHIKNLLVQYRIPHIYIMAERRFKLLDTGSEILFTTLERQESLNGLRADKMFLDETTPLLEEA